MGRRLAWNDTDLSPMVSVHIDRPVREVIVDGVRGRYSVSNYRRSVDGRSESSTIPSDGDISH